VLGERYELGLIGWPIAYSLSPWIHKAALRALALPGDYRLFPIPPLPEGQALIKRTISDLRGGRLHGLNVTVPFKETILHELEDLTQQARAIGAVNTILRRDGHLIGDNTDAGGFLTDLQNRITLQPDRALILGAGGAARAIAYALSRNGWQVCVAARRVTQAESLVEYLSASALQPLRALAIEPQGLGRAASECALIVNATPVGTGHQADESPWPTSLPFPAGVAVYDLVYMPAETRLMRTARQAGGQALSGIGMLIEQAALALEQWTGRVAPRDVMSQAAQAMIEKRRPG
jgi:shikimate dehydrogenase